MDPSPNSNALTSKTESSTKRSTYTSWHELSTGGHPRAKFLACHKETRQRELQNHRRRIWYYEFSDGLQGPGGSAIQMRTAQSIQMEVQTRLDGASSDATTDVKTAETEKQRWWSVYVSLRHCELHTSTTSITNFRLWKITSQERSNCNRWNVNRQEARHRESPKHSPKTDTAAILTSNAVKTK